jgi:uncharacterized membrane protein YeiB
MKRLIGGIALAVVALFLLMGYFGSDTSKTDAAAIIALLLFIVLPAVGSLLLLRSHFRDTRQRQVRKEQLRHQTIESEILKLAIAKSGRLTAVEVATQLAISPEGATEALDRLALRGQAAYQVTDAGVIVYSFIVYSFYDIVHLGGKDSAKDVLDA